MTDLQIKGKKIALLDSSDNIIYTLPDSAGPAGNAVISDGNGKLFFGGINIDAVLAAGNTTNKSLTAGIVTANIVNARAVVDGANPIFQGTTSGYSSGGFTGVNAPGARLDTIDKFPFASDANATDVGDLAEESQAGASQSSATDGYQSGGIGEFPSPSGGPSRHNRIQKFPFASDDNATNITVLSNDRAFFSGQSSSTHGYTSGGDSPPFSITPSRRNFIEKFPFSSPPVSNVDVGDLIFDISGTAGHSSPNNGYVSGGSSGGFLSVIQKFPFSTDANSTNIGDLTQNKFQGVGTSSLTHGYNSGGRAPASLDVIDKFSFSTDENAVDVGDLINTSSDAAGQSSTANGYHSGASDPSLGFPNKNVIQKFSFSADANATDVGDLSQARSHAAGQQV